MYSNNSSEKVYILLLAGYLQNVRSGITVVASDRNTVEKPCAILNTSIRSVRFQRSSNVQSPNSLSLSS